MYIAADNWYLRTISQSVNTLYQHFYKSSSFSLTHINFKVPSVLHHTGFYFLKMGFVVAGGGFYSYYIHQENKLDKERKILIKN